MVIESTEAVFYTCLFLLPGFIINAIIDSFAPSVRSSDTKYFLSCLLYSIVNCSFASFVYVFLKDCFYQAAPVLYWFLIILVTVIFATLIAIAIGLIKQKEILECVCSCIGLRKIHPIPSAWDYSFSKQQASWVIVTLETGEVIYGKYSSNSFASSDPNERDLYLEKTYTLDQNKKWIEDPKSNGILISKDAIQAIEFLTGGT